MTRFCSKGPLPAIWIERMRPKQSQDQFWILFGEFSVVIFFLGIFQLLDRTACVHICTYMCACYDS